MTTTMKPMLAQTADARQQRNCEARAAWGNLQKIDGQRLLVWIGDGTVTFLNRSGEPKTTGVTPAIRREFARFDQGTWCFDGELIDNVLWIFDLPIAGHHVGLDDPYSYRYEIMAGLHDKVLTDSTCIRLLPLHETTVAKKALLARVADENCEGVIYRKLDAPYQPGLRSRDMLKWKLRQEVDCVVKAVGIDGKDNLQLMVYRDGKEVIIGEVTALAGDGPRITVGSVISVTYLYVVPGSSLRLVQPTLPRFRDDKKPEECTFDQLHFTNKKVLTS